MKRREFIAGLGSAAAWPVLARGQQPSLPVVGFLGNGSSTSNAFRVDAWKKGLNDVGYVEGKNVTFEYRWSGDQYDRLPALATELAHRKVGVIAAILTNAALAAKSASQVIPIVFVIGGDPVQFGLVTSLNRPGGNLTGFSLLSSTLVQKQFQMLHEVVPLQESIALLVNPIGSNAALYAQNVKAAADALGRNLHVIKVSNESDIEKAFAFLAENTIRSLLVAAEQTFVPLREKIISLASRYGILTIYSDRYFVEAGGLMSYGANLADVYRQAGICTGRIMKGENPADLPVQQSTKLEFVINLKTAKTLGIEVPTSILLRADEVIE